MTTYSFCSISTCCRNRSYINSLFSAEPVIVCHSAQPSNITFYNTSFWVYDCSHADIMTVRKCVASFWPTLVANLTVRGEKNNSWDSCTDDIRRRQVTSTARCPWWWWRWWRWRHRFVISPSSWLRTLQSITYMHMYRHTGARFSGNNKTFINLRKNRLLEHLPFQLTVWAMSV